MNGKNQLNGFSVVWVIIVVAVIVAVGLTGWFVWHKNKNNDLSNKTNTNSTSQTDKTNNSQQNQNQAQADPSEGGKYLVISEWGVRAALPSDLKGAVTYSLGAVTPDPGGNQIQATKILVASSALTPNDCATTNTSLGSAIESGGQYIRSETSKPFNVSRYRWTFKENILKDNGYAYHLNYVTSFCAGEGTNTTKIEALHSALVNLEKI